MENNMQTNPTAGFSNKESSISADKAGTPKANIWRAISIIAIIVILALVAIIFSGVLTDWASNPEEGDSPAGGVAAVEGSLGMTSKNMAEVKDVMDDIWVKINTDVFGNDGHMLEDWPTLQFDGAPGDPEGRGYLVNAFVGMGTTWLSVEAKSFSDEHEAALAALTNIMKDKFGEPKKVGGGYNNDHNEVYANDKMWCVISQIWTSGEYEGFIRLSPVICSHSDWYASAYAALSPFAEAYKTTKGENIGEPIGMNYADFLIGNSNMVQKIWSHEYSESWCTSESGGIIYGGQYINGPNGECEER